jgi:uncharacterized RDD family membrane protein YckC
MTKAGFFKRFLAAFIDGLLFGGIGVVLQNNAFGFLSIVYETILLSQWNGQTIGKKIMGIKVVTTSGGQLDWLKAFIRSVSKILSVLPLCLGYFWMLWDEKSQTWHDKIADTFVVEA